jgi:hypothetical protein
MKTLLAVRGSCCNQVGAEERLLSLDTEASDEELMATTLPFSHLLQ